MTVHLRPSGTQTYNGDASTCRAKVRHARYPDSHLMFCRRMRRTTRI